MKMLEPTRRMPVRGVLPAEMPSEERADQESMVAALVTLLYLATVVLTVCLQIGR